MSEPTPHTKAWEISRGFWTNCVDKGWQEKLVDPFLEVWRLTPEECRIDQIKEKFGGLRIYVSGPEWWQNLADALMRAAEGMCESCGRVKGTHYMGKDPETTIVRRTDNGWIKQYCQYCEPFTEKERIARETHSYDAED